MTPAPSRPPAPDRAPSKLRASLATLAAGLGALLFCLLNSAEAPAPAPGQGVRLFWLGMLLSLPLYLVPLGVALGLRGEARTFLRRAFTWPRDFGFKPTLYALLGLFAGQIALGSLLPVTQEQMAMELLAQFSGPQLLLTVLPLCVGVPLLEELLFRGLITVPGCTRLSIVLSALLFAMAHGLNGFVLPLSFVGLLLGCVAARTGSLLPGIVLHGLFNLVNLCACLF